MQYRAGLSITAHRGDNHRVVEASRGRCADAAPRCAPFKVLPPDRSPVWIRGFDLYRRRYLGCL